MTKRPQPVAGEVQILHQLLSNMKKVEVQMKLLLTKPRQSFARDLSYLLCELVRCSITNAFSHTSSLLVVGFSLAAFVHTYISGGEQLDFDTAVTENAATIFKSV